MSGRVPTGSPDPTPGQRHALAELDRIAAGGDGLRVSLPKGPDGPDGVIRVEVSLNCARMPRRPAGAHLRARERVTVELPSDTPHTPPIVTVDHPRFDRLEHVVWRQLCLYRAPGVEWDPADGMFGLIDRLNRWFRAAAVGQLDPDGAPLHPPLAVASRGSGLVVVHADAPRPTDRPWLGAALLRPVRPGRHDLVGWLELGATWPRTNDSIRRLAGLAANDRSRMVLAPAVLAHRTIGRGTYPATVLDLLDALAASGVGSGQLFGLLHRVLHHDRRLAAADDARKTDPDAAACPPPMIVGDLSRGVAGPHGERLAHIAAWELPAAMWQLVVDLRPDAVADPQRIAAAETALRTTVARDATFVHWLPVDDVRPETSTPRDDRTPASWLRNKKVLVLGLGALGAPVAELCARAGVRALELVDHGTVRHGILRRQPYASADVGHPKSDVLTCRLQREHPLVDVSGHVGDAGRFLDDRSTSPDYDLIIDATAHRGVRSALERRRRMLRPDWPTQLTLLIGPTAARGVAAISVVGASGGGADALRRLGLSLPAEATRPESIGEPTPAVDALGSRSGGPVEASLRDAELAARLSSDFFPSSPPELFTPEPGCSDATFVGSGADVTALVGPLFAGVLAMIADPQSVRTAVLAVETPTAPVSDPAGPPRWWTWPDDAVVTEHHGYEVRISPRAWATISGQVRVGARNRSPDVETGGTLFGGIDDAVGVIWVDDATGPPADSRLSRVGFHHGIAAIDRTRAHHRSRSRDVTDFVGMWHTHPFASPELSRTDEVGATHLVNDPDGPPRSLILVLGGEGWSSYLTGTEDPELAARLFTRDPGTTTPAPKRSAPPNPGRSDAATRYPATWKHAEWWAPATTEHFTHPAEPPEPTGPVHPSSHGT